MVSISDPMPAYTTEALIATGMGMHYDAAAKRAFEGTDAAAGHARTPSSQSNAAATAADAASMPRSFQDLPAINTDVHAGDHASVAAALGLDPVQAQAFLSQQAMQLNPHQPAFLPAAYPANYGFPGAFAGDAGLYLGAAGVGDAASGYGTSPSGYSDFGSPAFSPPIQHFHVPSPTMSPVTHFAPSPSPLQQAFPPLLSGSPSGSSAHGGAGGGGHSPGSMAVQGLGYLPQQQPAAMPPAVTFAGPYGPLHAMAGAPPQQAFGGLYPMHLPTATAAATSTSRTVYVGNLPGTASVDELLSQVRFGPIDNVKILPERSCAFISFLDPVIAAAFHSDMIMRKIALHGNELKIGWGKHLPIAPQVLQAVQQHGATRNVYLGNLDDDLTEQALRDDLSRFGPIDQVKIVRDKSIGFVHFLSIANAIKVVCQLPQEAAWQGKRVNYGKDRCAYVPKNQHQQQAHNLAAAQMAANYAGSYGLNLNLPQGGIGHLPHIMQMVDQENLGNRTIYLGNLHQDTTVEEICNSIRGGILQQIRYIPDKHICFVTFVDPNAALAFFTTSMAQGITIHARRLKIGWGKHSGPTPAGIQMVVQAGGSRNIYIGNIADFADFSEDRLRADFGVHGDIELVNLLREKNCGAPSIFRFCRKDRLIRQRPAFVNFTQISHAIKALEAVKQDPAYAYLKVAYGKDRCGNLPRAGYGMAGFRSGSSQGGRSPRRPPSALSSPAASPPIVMVDDESGGLLAAPRVLADIPTIAVA